MKETIQNLKKVYEFGKKYKINLIFEIIGAINGIVIGIVLPLLAAKQIVYFTSSIWEQVIIISLIIFGVKFIEKLNSIFLRRNTQIFRRGTVKNIQISLGNEILKINQENIDNNSSGTFIQRIVVDTDKMAEMFTVGMGYTAGVISNIGVFIAIFIINWQVFIYYLAVSIFLTILHLIKTKKHGKKDIEYRKQVEKVSSLTSELVRGVRDIKMLNSRESFMDSLQKNIEDQNQKNFEMRNIETIYNFIIGTLTGVFEVGLIVLLMILIKDDIITVAIAIALFNYRTNVMVNLMDKVSSLFDEIKNFNISCNRVFSILNDKTFSKEKFGNKHLDNVTGNFEFKNVSFGYDENKLILNNLSFKINAGETIGFVGKSGAGKTTIFNLLCKLYNVNSGEIFIENTNINELDEESIRGNITIISQNPYIFNLSIRDNLKLVKKDLTDEEIKEACKIACLDDFIDSLPKKYDTILGEGGVALSGGQKQRLAIARAFVQKTKIILFDEATSALDNETQYKIQKAIDNLKEEYTILIIAHRLSTIVNCDKIMVIEDGKIASLGTHKELLEKSLTYKKLCETEMLENNK